MNLLSSFFYYCDLFKAPFSLRFKSKIKISSPFSTLISIGIILFMCIYFFQSDIVTKKNPTTSIQSIASTYRPAINFDSANQGLAFGLSGEDILFLPDNSIFYFETTHYYYTSLGDLVYADKKALKNCEEKDFRDYGRIWVWAIICVLRRGTSHWKGIGMRSSRNIWKLI